MNESSPKEQCEALMREVLPLAKRMLTEDGEFYPYGGVINENGSITHVSAKEEETDHPKSSALIDILNTSFREAAAAQCIKASAVVFDVSIKPPGGTEKVDAIQVNLDHRNDYSVEVLFPYSLSHGKLLFGPPFAQQGDNRIFNEDRNQCAKN